MSFLMELFQLRSKVKIRRDKMGMNSVEDAEVNMNYK